jgi:pimeloyl-ACP methyl ester carboxylesterase
MLACLEALDPRLLLTAIDPGDTLAAALALGPITNTRSIVDSLSTSDSTDMVKFSVKSRGNVNLTLTGLSANADLQLLSSSGKVLAQSTNADTAREKLGRSLAGGTYYVRVFAAAAGLNTNYALSIQADLNFTSVTQNDQKCAVSILPADGSTSPIRTTGQTWIIVHGWQSSPDSLASLSSAVRNAAPKDQVLAIDWSSAAAADLLTVVFSVDKVAAAAAKVVQQWGIPGSRLNLIGHSFGGFLIDRLASRISGGVNRMVAIDPADDIITSVNYAAHSKYSLAFVASQYSTPAHALTADATFKMNVGDYDSIFSHTAAPELYAAMIQANADGNPDAISRVFALNRLSPTVVQPWKTVKRYEGTLVGAFSSSRWRPKSITYS